MEIIVKIFNDLTLHELHDLLQLRADAFVLEQDCVYPDIDGKDQKALHIIGKKEGKIIAYTRCFKPGDYFKEASIGRVVVDRPYRKLRYGHRIMKASIDAITMVYNTKTIRLSAQTYLTNFYETHEFKPTGKEYLEDGIPHIAMVRGEK